MPAPVLQIGALPNLLELLIEQAEYSGSSTRSQTLIFLCLYTLGLGRSSARASGYGSVIDHRTDVKLGI